MRKTDRVKPACTLPVAPTTVHVSRCASCGEDKASRTLSAVASSYELVRLAVCSNCGDLTGILGGWLIYVGANSYGPHMTEFALPLCETCTKTIQADPAILEETRTRHRLPSPLRLVTDDEMLGHAGG